MKITKQKLEEIIKEDLQAVTERCWDGHERVPGKREGEPGSCRKQGSVNEEELDERVFPQRPAHREATPEDMAALAALEDKPDNEGRMSKATLRRASEDAELINSMIREQEQLPAWVQEHISLAAENLQSVKQYMQSLRMDEQKEKVSLIP